jgi:type IV secretory pathway VirB4 component
MAESHTQDFVPIKEIRGGTIILEDGSMNTILLVASLNFALKSYDEQMATIAQFQNFLNSIEFSIQISIQSRKLDIRPYIATLEEKRRDEDNDLIKMQINEYMQFIGNFTDSVNIMEKKFFVVVSYTPPTLSASSSSNFLNKILNRGKDAQITDNELFEEAKSQLEQRVDLVSSGISRTGLRLAPLGTEEAVEVLYKIFNPGEAQKPISLT